MESRVRDLEAVKVLRSARLAAVSASSHGDIASVLNSTDGATQQVYVVKILDVHPRLGKVSGRRLLSDIDVKPFARLADLTAAQRARILEAVGHS